MRPFCWDYAPRHNSYWRLPYYPRPSTALVKRNLLEAGIGFSSQDTPLTLEVRTKRWARGLLDYTKCTTKELWDFARNRGLNPELPAGRKNTRRVLIGCLEDADTQFELRRFLSLPPEMRLLIYEYYIDNFRYQGLQVPLPPPIANTSSLVRSEFLPVFYSRCTFIIDLYWSRQRTNRGWIWKLLFKDETLIWLLSLSRTSLLYIQNLQFNIWDPDHKMPATVPLCLDPKMPAAAAPVPDYFKKDYVLVTTPHVEEPGTGLAFVVDSVRARPARAKLTLDDIYRMRNALEAWELP